MMTTKTHRIGPRMTQACEILFSKGGTMTLTEHGYRVVTLG